MMNVHELKEMLQKSAVGMQALSDEAIGQVAGGKSYLEQIKEIIDTERESKKNEPFPSFMNGIDIVMQRAYDSVIEYQEKNGVIPDDRAAEKMFWEHMADLN